MDWFDPLAVQETLKSLSQCNSKASVLHCPAFFMVQFSHPYMTIRKTIAFIRQAFVGKVMSLLFNMLHWSSLSSKEDFPGGSDSKASAYNVGDPDSIPGSGRSSGEGNGNPLQYSWASLVAQLVKNLPAMWENWV